MCHAALIELQLLLWEGEREEPSILPGAYPYLHEGARAPDGRQTECRLERTIARVARDLLHVDGCSAAARAERARARALCASASSSGAMSPLANWLPLSCAATHAVLSEPADLVHAEAMDRGPSNATVDLRYQLNVPEEWWLDAPVPEYSAVMQSLHGRDVWRDSRLKQQIELLGITGVREPDGTPLQRGVLRQLLELTRPRLFVEVGVFRGSTSTHVARLFARSPRLRHSFVISMDTWLLDLRFVWDDARKQTVGSYFQRNAELAGSSQMYFTFAANVLASNTSQRIIPLQTTSSNGAMALLAHKLRPDLVYIDASHANPDVLIDYVNFYTILAPGGVMAVDDVELPAVAHAFRALVRRFGLRAVYTGNGQAYVRKERRQPAAKVKDGDAELAD